MTSRSTRGGTETDGFETVYTVDGWYDGPEAGLADWMGRPHAYVRRFDSGPDDFVPTFEIWPIDEETLRLARERWAIWLRWEEAFYAKQTDIRTHPALPEDRARYEELKALLGERWERPPGVASVWAVGHFRAPAEGQAGTLRVQWTPAEPVPT